jgi:hypothetical protein
LSISNVNLSAGAQVLISARAAAPEIQDVGVDDGTGAEPWLLTAAEHALVREKSRANRLAFAMLLLFHRAHGRFPKGPTEVDAATVEHVARQLGMEADFDLRHLAGDRTWKRHRAEIRTQLGYREPTVADAEAIEAWFKIGFQAAAKAVPGSAEEG